jgi:outer membrane protein OmpA-like peptidoglycan-associated protein
MTKKIQAVLLTLLMGSFYLPVLSQDLQNDDAKLNLFITDMNDIPESDARITLRDGAGKKVVDALTDTSGKRSLVVKQGSRYHVLIQKYGHKFDFGVQDIPKAAGPIEFTMQFQIGMSDTSYEEVYTLEDVYFDSDKATLKPTSYKSLDVLVGALKSNANMVVEIAGHTDDQGDDAYNLRLSQKRSETVVKYLTSKGISADRLYAKGYGEKRPVAANSTAAGRAQNRRTEVRIIKQ